MNAWLWATVALTAGLLLCLVASLRRGRFHRLISVQLGLLLGVMALLSMGEGFDRSFIQDLSVATALVSLPGTLVMVRWLGRLD